MTRLACAWWILPGALLGLAAWAGLAHALTGA